LALFGIVVMAKYGCPSVFMQFAQFSLQMKMLVYHQEMFTDVWHNLFIDEIFQKGYQSQFLSLFNL
jgi:hypothetical protein